MDTSNMDTSLDKKFKEIEGLKWLPYIGNEYLNLETKNKTLIIGQSHYEGEDCGENLTRVIAEKFKVAVKKILGFCEELSIF